MATIYRDAMASDIHQDDKEIVEKLAKLQQMYQQVYQIRKLLPEKLIAPIKQATASPHANHAVSPAALAGQLRKVAVEGSEQIQSFKTDWHSDEMRSLWQQANAAHFPQGDDCWRADYAKLAGDLTKSTESARETLKGLAKEQDSVNEDPREVIMAAKDKNPALQISAPGDAVGLPLDLKVAGMSFRISREQKDTVSQYHVAGKLGSKASDLSQEMLRIVEGRENTRSLSYLINLLASYSDVKTRPCDKCQKVFDNSLQLALVKVPRKQGAEGDSEWSSFHRKCI